MNSLKNRLVKLEQAKKPAVCLVHFIEEIASEVWSETCERYRLEMGLTKEIVILSLADLEDGEP